MTNVIKFIIIIVICVKSVEPKGQLAYQLVSVAAYILTKSVIIIAINLITAIKDLVIVVKNLIAKIIDLIIISKKQ